MCRGRGLAVPALFVLIHSVAWRNCPENPDRLRAKASELGETALRNLRRRTRLSGIEPRPTSDLRIPVPDRGTNPPVPKGGGRSKLAGGGPHRLQNNLNFLYKLPRLFVQTNPLVRNFLLALESDPTKQ